MNEKITVLGGGINGITTGLVLELMGFDTEIVTMHRPDKNFNCDVPEMASVWGAGVIAWPVMDEGENLEEYFRISQDFFGLLNMMSSFGVRSQSLYKVGESNIEKPGYENHLISLEKLQDGEFRPSRKGMNVQGYRAEIFFAEMPFYIGRLYEVYQQAGGEVVEKELEVMEFLERCSLGVNCTGYWSKELFDDNSMKALKGKLLQVKNAPFPQRDSEVVSYTYNTDGESVYCFPRTDALILGGTSLEGEPIPGEEWRGEEIESETIRLDGKEIPKVMKKVNSDILRNSFGIDINDYRVQVGEGYRPYRKEGIRIEHESISGTDIIHNYGHGGSGITLSWGTAIEVARIALNYSEGSVKEFHCSELKKLKRMVDSFY